MEIQPKKYHPHDIKQLIHIIARRNGFNTYIVHILSAGCYGMFHLTLSIIGRLPTPVELSQKCILINSKYQQPELHAIIFDQYKEDPFKFPTGHKMFV